MKHLHSILGASFVLSSCLAVGCSAGDSASGATGGASSGADGGSSVGAGNGTGASDGGGQDGGGQGSGGEGGGGGPVVITPGSYALPPPDQCINKYNTQDEGCVPGDASSACDGLCTPPSAGHAEGKPGELGYMCPRNMLYSGEMTQAALDDAQTYGWGEGSDSPFTYAVVGHDNDGGVLDGPNGQSVCCQCYQLIPYMPEQQVTVNGEGAEPSVPLPKPLVVQAFNTGATPDSFDIYMGAGGTGAVKGCFDEPNGAPFYSDYPTDIGQDFGGGVKAVGNPSNVLPGGGSPCKTEHGLVTTDTLSSTACQDWVTTGCNRIVHTQSHITDAARKSCIQSNQPDELYHLNWEVYAKRVACPAAITQVTGCKLVEDLPAPDPAITAETALANGFVEGYHTTTMEDCAKPTCAARDWVTGSNAGTPHTVDGDYNSFYACNADGVPWTTPE